MKETIFNFCPARHKLYSHLELSSQTSTKCSLKSFILCFNVLQTFVTIEQTWKMFVFLLGGDHKSESPESIRSPGLMRFLCLSQKDTKQCCAVTKHGFTHYSDGWTNKHQNLLRIRCLIIMIFTHIFSRSGLICWANINPVVGTNSLICY